MSSQYEKRKAKEKTKVEKEAPTLEEGIAIVKVPIGEYTGEAYDVFYNETAKQYMKAVVSYNAFTNEATVKEIVPVADSQAVANYKIKEIFAKKLMGVK